MIWAKNYSTSYQCLHFLDSLVEKRLLIYPTLLPRKYFLCPNSHFLFRLFFCFSLANFISLRMFFGLLSFTNSVQVPIRPFNRRLMYRCGRKLHSPPFSKPLYLLVLRLSFAHLRSIFAGYLVYVLIDIFFAVVVQVFWWNLLRFDNFFGGLFLIFNLNCVLLVTVFFNAYIVFYVSVSSRSSSFGFSLSIILYLTNFLESTL